MFINRELLIIKKWKCRCGISQGFSCDHSHLMRYIKMLEADNEKLKKDLSECDMSCAATKGQKLPQRRVRGDFSRKKKEYTIGVDPAKPKSDKTVFQILCPMCRKVVVIEKGKTTECCAVEFKCN